mmetsp:Transcript_52912/g.129219  ORF Transcript_52912/g.129219 Transcript_52912/m.129219 type:complete len:459 (-) Transcript_52912:727-2103(-)
MHGPQLRFRLPPHARVARHLPVPLRNGKRPLAVLRGSEPRNGHIRHTLTLLIRVQLVPKIALKIGALARAVPAPLLTFVVVAVEALHLALAPRDRHLTPQEALARAQQVAGSPLFVVACIAAGSVRAQAAPLVEGLEVELHQDPLVVAAPIDDEDLARAPGLRDDVLDLDRVVPELKVRPVEALVPRVDDLVGAPLVVGKHHKRPMITVLIYVAPLQDLLPRAPGVPREVRVDLIAPVIQVRADVPRGHNQACARRGAVDRAIRMRGLAVEVEGAVLGAPDGAPAGVLRRGRNGLPKCAFVERDHGTLRNSGRPPPKDGIEAAFNRDSRLSICIGHIGNVNALHAIDALKVAHPGVVLNNVPQREGVHLATGTREVHICILAVAFRVRDLHEHASLLGVHDTVRPLRELVRKVCGAPLRPPVCAYPHLDLELLLGVHSSHEPVGGVKREAVAVLDDNG